MCCATTAMHLDIGHNIDTILDSFCSALALTLKNIAIKKKGKKKEEGYLDCLDLK